MRNIFLIMVGSLLLFTMGCGTSENTQVSEGEAIQENVPIETVEQTEPAEEVEAATNEEDNEHNTVTPHEPGEGETCSMCDMVVYHQHEEMGKFTGQVVTADGEHLFTDDVSCLMNQIRILEEEPLNAWVRDYHTLEWIPINEAAAVKADIQTPMNMGFALFDSETTATEFVEQNSELTPTLSSMEEIDKIAEVRYNKKMQMLMESQQKKEQ